jgi:hypothetical protein
MIRTPHCLDNWLIDGGKVVSLTHPTHFTAQKHYYFNVSGTFLLGATIYRLHNLIQNFIASLMYLYLYQQLQLIISTSFILSVHYMFRSLRPSSGEPQQHNLYIYENHHTTAHPLFYNYSPIWCPSLIIYLSTLQLYNGNSLIK